MKELLSGNEAIALAAYHAGVRVAAAYPGTPSTEILENLAKYPNIHAEWSTNEKVAMEVAMGACYTGVRAMASMKHVGLNVASDPFMAAATTGVVGGLVVVAASDPGMHSSQNEQDNRYFARLGKVAVLEPGDSQEAYELMRQAFDISEQFDMPVLFCPSTRVAHAKSVVVAENSRAQAAQPAAFEPDRTKLVMLPAYARQRHGHAVARLERLARFAETFTSNRVTRGSRELGIISGGVAFQYACEVFPEASFLKLAMAFPLPAQLIRDFVSNVDHLIVIEELEPFLEDQIKAMGIRVQGKEFIPRTGELNPDIVRQAALKAGWLQTAGVNNPATAATEELKLPPRPPLLCPGCPHTGIFFTLSSLGLRKTQEDGRPGLVITGDIGCYTLGAYPPLAAMDTCACMGAGLGQAQGMEWAGVSQKVVAVIGDSTFIHSGVSGLINAVYNRSRGTIIILDNSTTAMTGHQPHPGTGTTARGEPTQSVDLASLVRGIGVSEVNVVSAFDLKALRSAVRSAIDSPRLSVLIVRGPCAVQSHRHSGPCLVDITKCDQCDLCLKLGCPAIQKSTGHTIVDASLCIGAGCGLCAFSSVPIGLYTLRTVRCHRQNRVNKIDILLTGVGGQGVVLAGDILGDVALRAGCDVKKTDTLGMAQRGGSVVAHIRLADRVASPLIARGQADFLVAFEKLEALRWLDYLNRGSTVIINDEAIPPLSVGRGEAVYPGNEEINSNLKQHAGEVRFVDCPGLTAVIGSPRTSNIMLLGALSCCLPFVAEDWQAAIGCRLPPGLVAVNLAAFEAGRGAVGGGRINA